MATVARAYGLFLTSALSKEISWTADTVKCALCTASYTPNQDTHRYFSSVTNEITGTGYTAGGQTVTGRTLSYSGTTNILSVDCDDVVWTTATVAAIRHAVFYVSTGTASTSPLICWMDFGADRSATATDFAVYIGSAGLLSLTVG